MSNDVCSQYHPSIQYQSEECGIHIYTNKDTRRKKNTRFFRAVTHLYYLHYCFTNAFTALIHSDDNEGDSEPLSMYDLA